MREWQPFEELVDVDTIIAGIDEHQSELCDEEFKTIASAVPARVREFKAGRSLARTMLTKRDLHSKSIPTGSGGQPVWPKGITGSISHTESHIGVALASQKRYLGIGLDIERIGVAIEFEKELAFTPEELERFQSDPRVDNIITLFSCKEAAFKAVFPIVGEHLEFLDFEIDRTENDFHAIAKAGMRSASALAGGRGSIATRNGLVCTVFCVE